MRSNVLAVLSAALLCGTFALGCGEAGDRHPAVLLAAGDIAECDHKGDEATSRLLADYPNATIATLGDNAYQHGTPGVRALL